MNFLSFSKAKRLTGDGSENILVVKTVFFITFSLSTSKNNKWQKNKGLVTKSSSPQYDATTSLSSPTSSSNSGSFQLDNRPGSGADGGGGSKGTGSSSRTSDVGLNVFFYLYFSHKS